MRQSHVKDHTHVWSLLQETRSGQIAFQAHLNISMEYAVSSVERIEHCSTATDVLHICKADVNEEGDRVVIQDTTISNLDQFRAEVNSRVMHLMYFALIHSFRHKINVTANLGKVNAKSGMHSTRWAVTKENLVPIEYVIRSCHMSTGAHSAYVGVLIVSLVVYTPVDRCALSRSLAYGAPLPETLSPLLRHISDNLCGASNLPQVHSSVLLPPSSCLSRMQLPP